MCLQARVWQWKLDSALPSRLGQLGDWLYRAEEIVDAEINYAEKPEDTAKHIQSRVDEHKVRTLLQSRSTWECRQTLAVRDH